MGTLDQLLGEIRACQICQADLPEGPRPVVIAEKSAKLLIIGQAPGIRVHKSGIPWNDPSGDRLRDWLDVSRDQFYDARTIAIMPMGFCYPGTMANGGDYPPRPECAPEWHDRLLKHLPNIELTLLAGGYAQKHYLGPRFRKTVTATVEAWQEFLPENLLPLPHPSWRSRNLVAKNPWFDSELIPELRRRVLGLL